MSLFEYFGELPDPRRPYLISHRLLDIVTIAAPQAPGLSSRRGEWAALPSTQRFLSPLAGEGKQRG